MTLFKMKLETFIFQNMNETCEPYHSYSLKHSSTLFTYIFIQLLKI